MRKVLPFGQASLSDATCSELNFSQTVTSSDSSRALYRLLPQVRVEAVAETCVEGETIRSAYQVEREAPPTRSPATA